jgi:hypothetical protein
MNVSTSPATTESVFTESILPRANWRGRLKDTRGRTIHPLIMSTRPPRPTIDQCLGRAALDALAAAPPVDLDRLAEAILDSDIVDIELVTRLGVRGTDPRRL